MKLVWTKEIRDDNFMHWNCNCKPFVFGNKLFYAFKSIDEEKVNVIAVNLKDLTTSRNHIVFDDKTLKDKKVLRSKSWYFLLIDDKLYLYVGFLLDISQPKISISDLNHIEDEFEVKTEYDFGDKYLQYNYLSTIECFDKTSNNKIWRVKIRGYIYTEIELKNNCLLFGTAGKGGAFYCINLETGQVLTEHVNGDSSSYEWQNSSVILKDKKGNMQQINPFTGAVLDTLILKDKLFNAPILVDNQYIYTTVYNKKSNLVQLICVQNDVT